MKDLQLKSHRFRTEREADWRRLETLLSKAETKSARQLTDAELLELPVLYRSAVSSLSVARATSLDAALIAYLEGLATRGYFFIYGARTSLPERITRFFRHDWPAAIKDLWRETSVSGAVFIISVLAGYFLVINDMDWYNSIMPGEMGQGRDPTASTAFLKNILYETHDHKGLSAFATFLFTHNAQVSILAFALGFAFCLPTAFLMAETGLTTGALVALYASRGLGPQIWGWLMIHGTTELLACVISGAAGFRIGWAVAFPGQQTRMAAAAEAGKTAGTAMAGVVIMLVVAGVLEGVGRQTIIWDWARYLIGGSMLTLWLAYFYLPRGKAAAA